MHSPDEIAEENLRLRRNMRDLVALSTLPALWTGLTPEGIASSLADVLLKTLALEFVHVRLTGPSAPCEATRMAHPENAAAVAAAVATLIEDDRFESPRTLPDPFGGGTLHLAVQRFGIPDAAGVVIAASNRADFPTDPERMLLSTGANQTATAIQRHRAEQRLRLSEERFRALFNSMDQGFCIIEFFDGPHGPLSDYVHVQANPAYTENAGIPDIVGRKVRELVPDEADAWVEIYRNVLITGRPVRFERELVATNRHLELAAFRLEPPESRQVAVLFKDITDRKRKIERLQEAEAHFRTMADNAPTMLWVTDPEGSATYLSKQWYDFTGRPPGTDTGSGWLGAIHPEDVPNARAVFLDANVRRIPFHIDYRLRRHDGEYRWSVDAGLPRFEGGEFRGFVGTVTDTHVRMLAEQSLREADRRKDEFLATLAHELRNPLAPIRNAVQIMKMTDRPAARDEARVLIERQIDHMVRLVDDLMDISRITRDKLELRKEPTDLAAAIRNAVETSRPLIDQMGHHLSVELPAQPIVVDADLTRLSQVFLNLLNNSAKYTEPGGRIRLTARRQGSEVVVSVEDNGIGIPVESLGAVFEMYSQVAGGLSRSQGGLGIGLSLVKRLVEMHGGSISAQSDGPGRGSTFSVRLPVASGEDGPQHPDPEEATPQSALRILIVDDNRDSADSLAMMLKFMGNDTATAYDGEQAVAAAEQFRPDVILLDIGLPKLNGYEACRRIRANAHGAKALVIAQTGWGQDEDRQRTRDAGFDHHLVKPVDPQALMKLLAELHSDRVARRLSSGLRSDKLNEW